LWRSQRGIVVAVQREQLNPYGENSGLVGSKRAITLVSRKTLLISRGYFRDHCERMKNTRKLLRFLAACIPAAAKGALGKTETADQ